MSGKTLGFQPKSRALAEINDKYAKHAFHFAHKTRVTRVVQQELDAHMRRMFELEEESKHAKKEEEASGPTPEAEAETASS